MKKGDKVRIISTGQCYTTYSKIFSLFDFKNKKDNYFSEKSCKVVFTVIASAYHLEDNSSFILGIENDKGEQLAIDIKGVVLVKECLNEMFRLD